MKCKYKQYLTLKTRVLDWVGEEKFTLALLIKDTS